MGWYNDSILVLDEAYEIIQNIDSLEKSSINNAALLDKTKPKIKNCLENLRSPLDYVANYLFEIYCKDSYPESKLKDLWIKYPITYKPGKFYGTLRSSFEGLEEKNNEIVKIMKSSQPFKQNDKWLGTLKDLVNENKHQHLSIHKNNKFIKIDNFSYHGIQMENVTLENCGTALSLGGIDYDLITSFPPGMDKNTVESRFKIYFEDLNAPVIATLHEIHGGVSTVINLINQLEEARS